MKKTSLFLLFLMSASTTQAGHFYNTSDPDDLRDGSALNKGASMGFSDSHQAVLISPRLAVTAPHSSSGDRAENIGISFYGQQYRVIHSIDRPGLDVGMGDLRIYVLDRDVAHPDGKNPCLPVATQNREASPMTYPQGVIGHSLSHSPNIKLKGQGSCGNRYHSILYGRTNIDYAIPTLNDTDAPLCDIINVGMSASSCKDLMVPIGGDSGSPLYISLKNGTHAVWGVMSGVAPNDRGTYAAYTSLAQNIGWLQRKEQSLIDRNILPINVKRIQTADQDDWKPDGECLTVPPEFDPETYLALHEDVDTVARTVSNPLQFAQDHFMQNRHTEKREWQISALFSPDLYLSYNPDLEEHISTLSLPEKRKFLTQHFARWGRHEGRQFSFPTDFDAIAYLTLNPEVAKVAHTQQDPLAFATYHYKENGIREKRNYSDSRYSGFDPEVYLALHDDVRRVANNTQNPNTFALWHFTVRGLEENRHCKNPLPSDFDARKYIENHIDLSIHLATNPELDSTDFAQHHYQTRGSVLEGRSYK